MKVANHRDTVRLRSKQPPTQRQAKKEKNGFSLCLCVSVVKAFDPDTPC
jgi:hypothetical protein